MKKHREITRRVSQRPGDVKHDWVWEVNIGHVRVVFFDVDNPDEPDWPDVWASIWMSDDRGKILGEIPISTFELNLGDFDPQIEAQFRKFGFQ